ncbi:NOT2/NOT3/NOT5 family protein (macronuclear) [Tetrahymena thermophila SB210]|uniref:NOT2/NOT3/NOT5 family protein n=1 Tax=Tetrahymena thermophila (strain SB210) TaxID=312017 RepID=Q24DA4_TETTS|nr:NOT2/NOT3/NOT5 family protein [Tetrahymena thermophila SB210]EAS05741.3 NOT2/NOT3/NOT5 family protein [Tetrahymena thermophila SB210]|eukprot:XP_001025986.3 NOT2/NOT3/NOT5 family protein [Tetrahymena thermophila SB210]
MNQGGYPAMYQPIQAQYIQQPQPQHQILIQQQLQQSQQVPILNQGIPGYQQTQILNPQFNDDSKKKKTLVGKMEELKNVPNEKQMYVFGMDIPQTGITNLNQEGLIHQTFGSPFAENPSVKTDALNFQIPQSYQKPQVQLNPTLIKKLPEDTLFYIFYNYPDETQQFAAVQVLYEKGWKYNHNMLTWIKEIEEVGKNLYKFSFFNFKEWKTLKADNIEMNLQEDLVTLADFEKSMTVDQNKQI